MRINIVTIFPAFFEGPLGLSIPARAAARGLVEYRLVDLRQYTHDRHRTVDDYPFGGGAGMVMKPEPFFEAVDDLKPEGPVVLLSARGRRVLEGCRGLLAAEAELAATVTELRAGWEPAIAVVFDGIVPIDPLLHAVGRLVAEKVPTKIDVRAEFLAGVEDAFQQLGADLMIAVLPPRAMSLVAIDLPALPASLVARADHPLARGRHDVRALRGHLLLTVRGSDPRLELPTAAIEARSTVHLNDFTSKHAAVLAGIGYGWLPDALIAADLAKGRLRRIRWTGASRHVFHPRLYHRGQPGPAARQLIDAL